MNRILVTKETGWSGVGDSTSGFSLAETFYFDKPYLIDIGIQGTIPAGIQVTALPSNGGEVLIFNSESTPADGKYRFNWPTSSISFTVSRVPEAMEEGPFTGSYSLVISVWGE